MIRFSCPVCEAKYSSGDERGGLTVTCPKCKSQFIIPPPEPKIEPPLQAAIVIRNVTVPIAPCPGCWSPLQVASSDVGLDIECPHCSTVYTAVQVDEDGNPIEPTSRPTVIKAAIIDDQNESDKRPRKTVKKKRR